MGDEARVLIVCTGNICRSPFIERLLQHELEERGRGADEIIVSSAGTGALVGSAMDHQAVAQLMKHGGDASGFRARALTPALIDESDLILTATRAHRGKVALMSPKSLRRVFTFCDFADLVGGIGPSTAPPGKAGSGERVHQVTEEAAASRGLTPPLAPDAADIIDPYRRDDEVFTVMAEQILNRMPAVVRALVG
jgi:protein-tyrosine phosphatase